jgi:transposase
VELIMTAPLSQDLRERIVRAVDAGSTIRQAARRFAVSASAAIKLMQRVRQTGSLAPAQIGGYRRPLLEKHADELRGIVSSQAGITLREIKAALAARGIAVKALSTIADMLHRLGLSHKKRSLRASEQDRPDVARHRSRWRVWQRYMDGARFVFLDETSATTAMTRRSGWGPKGERLVDAAPAGHWKTTTFVAGLRASGIIAPFVLDGPMTGDAFRIYVEQVLAPELEPGDAVVMDNLSTHKVAGVREAIRAAGASVLYLPSYSPDFNPIEQLFAKFKALLRKAAARTLTALWQTIGTSLDDFTPAECQNYIVNSGYEFV